MRGTVERTEQQDRERKLEDQCANQTPLDFTAYFARHNSLYTMENSISYFAANEKGPH